jgi:hypothetical protein
LDISPPRRKPFREGNWNVCGTLANVRDSAVAPDDGSFDEKGLEVL